MAWWSGDDGGAGDACDGEADGQTDRWSWALHDAGCLPWPVAAPSEHTSLLCDAVLWALQGSAPAPRQPGPRSPAASSGRPVCSSGPRVAKVAGQPHCPSPPAPRGPAEGPAWGFSRESSPRPPAWLLPSLATRRPLATRAGRHPRPPAPPAACASQTAAVRARPGWPGLPGAA